MQVSGGQLALPPTAACSISLRILKHLPVNLHEMKIVAQIFNNLPTPQWMLHVVMGWRLILYQNVRKIKIRTNATKKK